MKILSRLGISAASVLTALALTVAVSPAATASAPSDVGTQAFYADCGFYPSGYRSGSTINGRTYTECQTVKYSIRHFMAIERSRWFGWEPVAGRDTTVYTQRSYATHLSYNCAGTGTHNFRLRTWGYIRDFNGLDYSTGNQYVSLGTQTC